METNPEEGSAVCTGIDFSNRFQVKRDIYTLRKEHSSGHKGREERDDATKLLG